jgi:hypothetical protein
VLRAALAQLPNSRRPGKNVLIRVDGAGGTHGLIDWLTRRRLAYSVGFSLPGDLASIQKTLASAPAAAWTPAYDADGQGPARAGRLQGSARAVRRAHPAAVPGQGHGRSPRLPRHRHRRPRLVLAKRAPGYTSLGFVDPRR